MLTAVTALICCLLLQQLQVMKAVMRMVTSHW